MGKKNKAKGGIDATNASGGQGDLGATTADCPKKKPGSLVVVLARTDAKKLKETHTVVVTTPSGSKLTKTTSSNKASFKGLEPGAYTVETTLSDKLLGAVIQSGDENQGADVPSGGEALVNVRVDPLKLTVKVVLPKDDAPANDVTVSISGGATAKKKTAGGESVFDEPKPGATHSIALTLPKALDEDYEVPKKIDDVDMPDAADAETTVKLLARPEPIIEIDDPKVVIVPRSYHGKPSPGVNPHRVKVTLKSDIDFDGDGVFSCAPDHIKVFDAALNGNELALPLTVANADIGGKVIYIQAKTNSASKEGTNLKFKLQNGTVTPKPEKVEKITCVKLDLDIFKTRPEKGGDPTKLDEDPKLDPGRPIVLQKEVEDVYFSERAMLKVHKALPKDFDGTLVLEALSANVSVFQDEHAKDGQTALAGADLEMANAKIDSSKGKIFWVEGTTVSGAMKDSGLKIGVKGIDGEEGDRVTVTVIQVDLELSQSRSQIPANGDPPAAADQFKDGRYLHKQKDQFHGRARLVVKQVVPAAFIGTLTLDCFHVSHKGKYSGSKASSKQRVRVFQTEVPAVGDAAEAYPCEITHDGAYPATGKVYWIEGSEISGDLKDAEIRLGVKDYEKGSDRVTFTVVKLKNIRAVIPSTQPNQKRRVTRFGSQNGPVKEFKFKAGDHDDAKQYNDDFTVNDYLPVVQGALGADKIELTVEVEPKGKDIPVLWDAVRDRLENANIAALAGNRAKPTVTQDGSNKLKATLDSDAGGGFHVVAYVDGNGDALFNYADAAGTRIDREPFVMLNVIFYYVRGVANNTITRNNAGSNGINKAASGVFQLPTGLSTGDFNGAGNDAIDMDATVHVVGTGASGTTGLDRLFGGWLNNEMDCPSSPGAHGEDVTHTYASWPPDPPEAGQTRCFWRQGSTEIAGPVLDSGYAGQGSGGNSCTGTAGGNNSAATVSAGLGGLGEQRRYFNVDSPGGGIVLRHPKKNKLIVASFKFNIDFRCALIFWTGSDGPSKTPCNTLYATAYTNTWNIRSHTTYASATLVETVVTPVTVTAALDGNRNTTTLDGTPIETRRPDGLNNLATDIPY